MAEESSGSWLALGAGSPFFSTGRVIPEHGGKHGHPVVVGREIIELFLKAAPSATAREVEHAHQHRIEYLAVDDPLVVTSVDTPEDYQRLIAGAAQGLGQGKS